MLVGGGQGVRILSPKDLDSFINPENAKKANSRLKAFFHQYCDHKSGKVADTLVKLELDTMELGSYLVQEFIPSKPIRSSQTEQDHDSCIRAIIFDGKFIDAYHRLSPRPLSDPETSLKYIGNLHYGALAEAVSDEDKTVVADFAENVVRTLEGKIESCNIVSEQDFRQFREKFWRGELERAS